MPRTSELSQCNGCPLQKLNLQFIPPKPGQQDIVVIGDLPGEEDVTFREPFAGGATGMVNGWLTKVGLSRNDVWMTNTLACRPPQGFYPTDPKARAYCTAAEGRDIVRHCREQHLLPLLRSRTWSKAILLGRHTLLGLTTRTDLFKWSGTALTMPDVSPDAVNAVPTLHPMELLRQGEMLPLVLGDLRRPLVAPPENYTYNLPAATLMAMYADGPLAIDIETDVPPTRIRIISLSNKPLHGTSYEFGGDTIAATNALLRGRREIITQNGVAFDIPHLRRHGIVIPMDPDATTHWDTMLMHGLVWPTLPHDLGTLGRQYTGKPFWKDWDLEGDSELLYAARDADVTVQVYIGLRREMAQAPALVELYKTVQVPVARICKLMEDIGVQTDPAQAAKMAVEADRIIAEQEALLPPEMQPQTIVKRKRIAAPEGMLTPLKYGKSGKPLKRKPVKWVYTEESVRGTAPWRNSAKTSNFLYKTLGLKQRLTGDGKVTTGKKALAALVAQSQDPRVEAVRQLRVWASRKNICAKLQEGEARRVHARFNPVGTATGRLSCSGGDTGIKGIQLQNITEDMRVIFVPSHPDWVLVSRDFSQMEARLAAWFANDDDRMARFDIPGFSEYKLAASIFLGIPVDQVPKDKSPGSPYHRAKTIVLGTDRALGARKISMQEDIPLADVMDMQQRWKNAIPKTMEWQRLTGEKAQRERELWNPFNRRGRFYTRSAYTEGISFMPQSTGFDIAARCMIALMYDRIEWPRHWAERVARVVKPLPEPARLLMQVHDELVFECPREMVDDVIGITGEVMTQPWPELNELALPSSPAVGENWGKMVDLK